jgi:predicted RNA-binding Zn ribbon-like protein
MSGYRGAMSSDIVPPAASAIVKLLNSRAHTIHPEKLTDAEAAAEVLVALGSDGASGRQLAELRRVRSDLLAVLSTGDSAEAWAAFTADTAAIAYRQDFTAPARATLIQVAGDPLIGRVVSLVGELVATGAWGRLRLCANDECRSTFYDSTRSRSQRWHSYEVCGNKHNVASYRARATAIDPRP